MGVNTMVNGKRMVSAPMVLIIRLMELFILDLSRTINTTVKGFLNLATKLVLTVILLMDLKMVKEFKLT